MPPYIDPNSWSAQGEAHASLVVSIIIPVHNQSHHTNTCLASICRYHPDQSWEVIVVDDGSTDDTVSVVARWAAQEPRISLVSNPAPHRFAAACNRGAQAARGSYLLFLNNDIELLEGWFQPLIATLLEHPEVGIAAAKLLFPNGTIQHCGKVLKRDSQGLPVFEHIFYEQPDGAQCSGGEFPTVTGACMLVRRAQFYQCGPFDERYENGWEDDDLCLSFREQGLSAVVCSTSVMIHHQGGTLKAEAASMERFLTVMRQKGCSLAPDDPLLSSLKMRIQDGAERFEKALLSNRTLFYDKWLSRLQPVVEEKKSPAGMADQAATIIIVSYNSAGTIGDCLRSVLATLRAEDRVIVVDNASQDATVAMVHDSMLRDRRLENIANLENRGYGAAANQGLDRAETPYIVFLNPDTVVTEGWLDRLLAHCQDERVVAVGPVSNFAAGEQSVDRHWRGSLPTSISPDEAAALLYAWNRGTNLETPLLIGFCLLVQRAPLVALGGLDERLFVGNDDLELSWRLRLHGHILKIARDVFIYHEGQHSFRTEPSETVNGYLQESSAALYRILEDHYGSGRVPDPQCLWGIDWFSTSQGVFNPSVAWHQVLTMPRAVRTPHASDSPLVSIIILTCNQLRYTQECITALLRHTPEPIEVIVVDNGSSDGTVAWLQTLAERDSRFSLILNSSNRGFAAGCNQGLEKASGRYMVLLNNDVVVTPEWLAGLLECHAAVPEAGIVGPLTNSASGIQVIATPDYPASGGLDQFALCLRSANRFRRVPSRRIVGFCALFSRRLYEKIGPLDESFGTGNYEDDDYCLRSAIAGYRNLVAGDVYVHHYGGISFGGLGLDYRASLAENSGLFREKWSRPVTDPVLAERIAVCRAREDLEGLLQAERYSEAEALMESFARQFPGQIVLGEAAEAMLRKEPTVGEQHDSGAGLPLLAKARLVRQRGEEEYARALVIKAFSLEPWRPALIEALQALPNQPEDGLTAIIDAASRLYPHNRGLSRLRVERLALNCPTEGLAAAEQFLRDFGLDDTVLRIGLELRSARGKYRTPAPSGKSVALCMIVRNEEHCLARCLASCKPIVHELVIVETGSDDRTRLIAELFGATVLSFPWSGDFSAARNASLAGAHADWLLVMDADEVISVRDYDLFRQVLAELSAPTSFSLTTRNYTQLSTLDGFKACSGEYPEDEAGAGWTPSSKIRLFPNFHGINFEGLVHELVETSVASAKLPILPHPVVIHHYGGLEESRLQRKRQFYYDLGIKKLNSEQSNDVKALYELAVQAAELEKFDEAEKLWKRFLESCHDYAPAWCNFGYVLMRKGQLEGAWSATEQALKLQPDYQAARVNRALCAFCRWPASQALGVIQSELERIPRDIILRVLVELCKSRGDRVGEAITALRHIAAQGYRIDSFMRTTAALLDQLGKNEEASHLKRVLAEVLR